MPNSKLEISRGDVLASKYEVLDLLDENPLGLTYRVKHLKSGKFVRLTMLRPAIVGPDKKDLLKDAFKEAKALQHPNIMKVGELGEHDGIAYYTMEDFEGSTLRELIQQYKIEGKQFELKDAAQILMQLLEGLSAIHETGRVVRALRPENILVNVRHTGPRRQNFVAHAKIVGAILWDLVPAAALIEDEFTRGEAQYIAPELKSFEPVPCPQCDLYSIGICLYEMLTGSAPVGTFQLPTTLRPDLPKHVNDVVELALANSPEDRYQTARDLINNIQRTFEQTANDEPQVRPAVGIAAAVTGVVFVIAIGALLFFMQSDPIEEAKLADQQLLSEIKKYYDDNPTTPADKKAILAKHPKGMQLIPAGPHLSGRLNFEPIAWKTDESGRIQYDPSILGNEPVAVRQELPAFLIDIFEFPNQLNGKPVARVSFIQAEKACKEQGKRLCSADEWEKACKGSDSLSYSYGMTWDPDLCGDGYNAIAGWKSGALKDCRSQWGVFDLSGGFAEWTSTPATNDSSRRVLKGGNIKTEKGTRCSFSTDESPGYANEVFSFRCCRNIDAPPVPVEPAEPEEK